MPDGRGPRILVATDCILVPCPAGPQLDLFYCWSPMELEIPTAYSHPHSGGIRLLSPPCSRELGRPKA